jgi:hypothetical protein
MQTWPLLPAEFVTYSVLSVAYLISPYLIIRRSMIIADESYCGSSSVGIEPMTLRLKTSRILEMALALFFDTFKRIKSGQTLIQGSKSYLRMWGKRGVRIGRDVSGVAGINRCPEGDSPASKSPPFGWLPAGCYYTTGDICWLCWFETGAPFPRRKKKSIRQVKISNQALLYIFSRGNFWRF